MEQYIDKAAVVAEVEKTYNFHEKRGNIHDASICDVLYGLLHRINTLEVKEAGVDISSPEGDLGRKTVQVIDADGNISEITFNKAQKGEEV